MQHGYEIAHSQGIPDIIFFYLQNGAMILFKNATVHS